MRITGGTASGRILKAPKGLAVRPTPDLVKQAVFNSLGARIVDARVLELYAGTGALSLDSLSRGAARAVCVEGASRHARIIRENLKLTGLPVTALDVRTQDVFAALKQMRASGVQFDLILADPPYGQKNAGSRSRSEAQRLLDDTDLPGLLAADGLFILGHARRDALEIPPGWSERKELRHGDSVMRFLTRAEVPESAAGTVPPNARLCH
jgi:16S rRNA (guanine(966)-N(2))-methyltransferase RsmD